MARRTEQRGPSSPRWAAGPAGLVAALMALALLGACASNRPQSVSWNDEQRRLANSWMVRSVADLHVEAAIVRQRTIYAQHFTDDAATLNPRGERELKILARHYADHGGGDLILSRIGTEDGLYVERLETVRTALADAGAPVDMVTIEDGLFIGDPELTPRAAAALNAPSSEEPYSFHEKKETSP